LERRNFTGITQEFHRNQFNFTGKTQEWKKTPHSKQALKQDDTDLIKSSYEEETKQVVFGMKSDVALGPNGYGASLLAKVLGFD